MSKFFSILDFEQDFPLPSLDPDPHQSFFEKELNKLVDELPPRERESLFAYAKTHPGNLACRHLAKQWGCTQQTVYNYAHRGAKTLRSLLEER